MAGDRCFPPAGPAIVWDMSTSADNGSRRPLIIVCLAAALVLVVALGYEAVTAARAQRDAVEGVLQDYAALAADQYARNVAVTLEYEWFLPAQRLLAAYDFEAGQPPTGDAPLKGQRNEYVLADVIGSLYRLDLDNGEIKTLDLGAETPDSWLRDAVRTHADTLSSSEWPYTAFLQHTSDLELLLVYRRESGGTVLSGFAAEAETLHRFLADAVEIYDLLPATLTDDSGTADLVHVRVIDQRGQTRFAHGPEGEASISATAELPPYHAGLRVVASIPASSAGRLVVGGLPYSRLPIIAGLLAITFALLGIGVVLWRREQELVDLREQFVAGASHELRTPLAQIRMFAETLRLERVRNPEEQRRSLDIIDREARRLAVLVDNLLQFSSSSGREQRFVPERADLCSLAKDVVDGFRPLSAAAATRIELIGADRIEARIDRDMFRQMLVNLLDNAIKYGPEGQTVTVDISANGDQARVAVTDQGPGVPVGERSLVWQRFWRGPHNVGVTGTGIGLALVRELVELHGGTVGVSDGDDGGARFELRLPRESA